MSRTFRRRNHEAIYLSDQDGTKIGGFYRQREFDYSRYRDYSDLPQRYCHGGVWLYRAPTPQEKNHDYWKIHKDGRYFLSKLRPWRRYRQYFDADLKTHDEGELRRYLAQPDDYEPQFWVMKSVDWREWD